MPGAGCNCEGSSRIPQPGQRPRVPDTKLSSSSWAAGTWLEQLEEEITFLTSLSSIMTTAVTMFFYIKRLTAMGRQAHKSSGRTVFLC